MAALQTRGAGVVPLILDGEPAAAARSSGRSPSTTWSRGPEPRSGGCRTRGAGSTWTEADRREPVPEPAPRPGARRAAVAARPAAPRRGRAASAPPDDAEGLVLIQALASLATVGLVAARAVNILGS